MYSLGVKYFRDRFGTPVDTTKKVYFSVSVTGEKAFYLVKFRQIDARRLELEFSDAVDILTGSDPLHYKVDPNIEVISASVDQTTSTVVHLIVSSKAPMGALGKGYVVSVSGVKSTTGVDIVSGTGSKLAIILSKVDLSEVFAYPNPYERRKGTYVMFANLTKEATVTIWTLSGNHVKTLNETDGDGGLEWFLDDESGNTVSSGVYIYRVTGTNNVGEKVADKTGKVAVLR
jgi:hypothetical protein